MLSAAIRSRHFSIILLCSLVLFLLASLAFAAEECPACTDFLGRPYAKVMVSADQDTHIANIVVYYDNTSVTPSRQPVGNSIIIVELTNSSGLRRLYKTYTDANGKASFDFTQWDKACVDIKALYCPFCSGPANDCGFAQCISYAKIHNESGYYSNINVDITNADVIPVWGSAAVPSPLNPDLYFPDYQTVPYCAPPPSGAATPALCFPLIIIFALLSGALYMTGRNPFASFNIGQGHVGRHIRYQARGRGFSMNIASVATAVSSAVKVAKGPMEKTADGKSVRAKNADGTLKSRWQAFKEEARATGGPLKALGGPLASGSRSSMALAKHREASTLSGGKGIASKEYRQAMDTLRNPSTGASGVQSGGKAQFMGANLQYLGGSSGGFRMSDLMRADGKGLDWKAFGLMVFSGTALGRIVDSFMTIKGYDFTMMGRYVDDKGKAAVRAENDKAVIAMYNKIGGLPVPKPNGEYGVLIPGSAKPDESGNITLKYKVQPEDSAGIMKGDISPKTVTVTLSKETGADGKPVLKNTENVTINIGGKEFAVQAKPDPQNPSKTIFFVNAIVDGKPKEIPITIEKNNTLSIPGAAGQPNVPVQVTKGFLPPEAAGSEFGAKDGKMVSGDTTLKVASVVTAFSVAGSKEDMTVTSFPGKESVVKQPADVNFPDAALKKDAEKIALNTLGVSSLTAKDNVANLLGGQSAAISAASTTMDSLNQNIKGALEAKNEERGGVETKARVELGPEAMAKVNKATQAAAGDLMASRGIDYTPSAESGAGSNAGALFAIGTAMDKSIFGELDKPPEKREKINKMSEEIAAKAGLPPERGAIIAAVVENMAGQSIDALKGKGMDPNNPEAVNKVMTTIVEQAKMTGAISDADATKLMNLGLHKEIAIAVQVEAGSAAAILAAIPNSNVGQVPVAELNSIRNETAQSTNAATGIKSYEIPLASACERAGVAVPPSLAKFNGELRTLEATETAVNLTLPQLKDKGEFTDRTMKGFEVIASSQDAFWKAGITEALPGIPKEASNLLNAETALIGEKARGDATVLKAAHESDPEGKLSVNDAFAKRMDQYKEDYTKALDPDHPDFAAATKIAYEAKEVSNAVGDKKAASAWDYLGEAPSAFVPDQIAGKFEPTAAERKAAEQAADSILSDAMSAGSPKLEDLLAAEKAANEKKDEMLLATPAKKMQKEAYESSIYVPDLDPKKGVIPSGADVAIRTEDRLKDIDANIGRKEEQAAKIVEEAAKKESRGAPEQRLYKKPEEKPEKKA